MKRKIRVLFSLLPNKNKLENRQRDEYGRFLYRYSTLHNLFRTDVCGCISKQKNRVEYMAAVHGIIR